MEPNRRPEDLLKSGNGQLPVKEELGQQNVPAESQNEQGRNALPVNGESRSPIPPSDSNPGATPPREGAQGQESKDDNLLNHTFLTVNHNPNPQNRSTTPVPIQFNQVDYLVMRPQFGLRDSNTPSLKSKPQDHRQPAQNPLPADLALQRQPSGDSRHRVGDAQENNHSITGKTSTDGNISSSLHTGELHDLPRPSDDSSPGHQQPPNDGGTQSSSPTSCLSNLKNSSARASFNEGLQSDNLPTSLSQSSYTRQSQHLSMDDKKMRYIMQRLANQNKRNTGGKPLSQRRVKLSIRLLSSPAEKFCLEENSDLRNLALHRNRSAQPSLSQSSRNARSQLQSVAFDPENVIYLMPQSDASQSDIAEQDSLLLDALRTKLSGLLLKEGSELIVPSIKVKLIGVCGRPKAMFQALADNGLIAHSETALYEKHCAGKGSGLYLVLVNKDPKDMVFLLMLYSKDERDFDKVDEKRGYTRLLGCLTQLCPLIILAINQRDVKLISSKKDIEPLRLSCDNCELTGEKIIDPTAGSKTLIATSSRCGFYTKSSHPSKTEITKGVHRWKDKDDYDRAFRGCVVRADKLDAFETEAMHNFLHQHFPTELETVHELLLQKLGRKFWTALLAIQHMKLAGVPEHSWLKKAAKQPQFLSAKKFALIRKCFVIDFKSQAEDQSKLTSIFEEILKEKIFPTDIIAMRKILKHFEHRPGYSDIEERLKASQNEVGIKGYELKTAEPMLMLYRDLIDHFNGERGPNEDTFLLWDFEKLEARIETLKSSQDFLNENFESCTKDARRMFKLVCRKIRKDLDVKRIEAEVREQFNGQFESVLKKKLFLQATKDCLERDEGKAVVRITALKEPTAGSFQLEYTKEDITEALNEYSVSQYEIGETDLGHTKVEDCNIECPASKPLTTFRLPASNELVKMMFVNEHSLAVAVNSQGRSQIMLYSTTDDGKVHCLPLFDQAIYKIDYNDNTNKLGLYTENIKEGILRVFRAGKDFSLTNEATINLNDEFGITGVRCLCLGNKSEVFLVDGRGTLWNVDYASKSAEPLTTRIKDIKSILLVPGAHCLLLVSSINVVPYVIETDKVLPRILLSSGTKLDSLVITKLGSQILLLFECEGKIFSSQFICKLNIETPKLRNNITEKGQADSENSPGESVPGDSSVRADDGLIRNFMNARKDQSTKPPPVVYLSHATTHDEKEEAQLKKIFKKNPARIQGSSAELHELSDGVFFILKGKNHRKWLYSKASVTTFDRLMQDIQDFMYLISSQDAYPQSSVRHTLTQQTPPRPLLPQNDLQVKEAIAYVRFKEVFSDCFKPIIVITAIGKDDERNRHRLTQLLGPDLEIADLGQSTGCSVVLKSTNERLYVWVQFEHFEAFKMVEDEKACERCLCILVKDASKKNDGVTARRLRQEIDNLATAGPVKYFIQKMYGAAFSIFVNGFYKGEDYENAQLKNYRGWILPNAESSDCRDVLDVLNALIQRNACGPQLSRR